MALLEIIDWWQVEQTEPESTASILPWPEVCALWQPVHSFFFKGVCRYFCAIFSWKGVWHFRHRLPRAPGLSLNCWSVPVANRHCAKAINSIPAVRNEKVRILMYLLL